MCGGLHNLSMFAHEGYQKATSELSVPLVELSQPSTCKFRADVPLDMGALAAYIPPARPARGMVMRDILNPTPERLTSVRG